MVFTRNVFDQCSLNKSVALTDLTLK